MEDDINEVRKDIDQIESVLRSNEEDGEISMDIREVERLRDQASNIYLEADLLHTNMGSKDSRELLNWASELHTLLYDMALKGREAINKEVRI